MGKSVHCIARTKSLRFIHGEYLNGNRGRTRGRKTEKKRESERKRGGVCAYMYVYVTKRTRWRSDEGGPERSGRETGGKVAGVEKCEVNFDTFAQMTTVTSKGKY